MENASKALLIAAEVLLGVLIISGFVYLFLQSGEFANNYYDSVNQQEIQAFNAQFEKYNVKRRKIDGSTEYIGGLTTADLITLINLAYETNKEYGYEKVKIEIQNIKTSDSLEKKKEYLQNAFFKPNNEDIQYYEISKIQYKEEFVSYMYFTKSNN